MMLSSFVYVSLHMGASTIEKSIEVYFEDYHQEDFVLETSSFLTTEERQLDLEGCPMHVMTLPDLYQSNRDCYYQVVDYRVQTVQSLEDIEIEARFYKDITSEFEGRTHRYRLTLDNNHINQSLYTKGRSPNNEHEIAILENYAQHQDLTIGDELLIHGQYYEITGFMLLPDYTLPVFDHIVAFGTESQSLIVMHKDAFDGFSEPAMHHLGGVFTGEAFTISEFYERHELQDYGILHMSLTEHNIRSGAVYTEIQASYASGLFISILIAFIGIVIVGLMMKKTLDQSKRPFGILKALGLSKRELMWPYLIVLLGYSFLVLWLGYLLGMWFAPHLRDIFLAFYLLPKTEVAFSLAALLIGVFTPFLFLSILGLFITNKLLSQDALTMMNPSVNTIGKIHKSRFKKALNIFPFNTRYQIVFMLRHKLKVLIYSLGVFFAFFLSFLALGMLDVFSLTVIDYYDSVNYTHIGYYPSKEVDGEKAIEMEGLIFDSPAVLIGLSDQQQMHPLYDRNDNDLTPMLEDGLVISKSFSLLNDISLNDEVEVFLGGQTNTLIVKGIAEIYPGNQVFLDRALLGDMFFDDREYFNAIYSDVPLEEEDFQAVFSVSSLMQQIEDLNEVLMQVFYVIILSGLFIGLIIIYLLSVLIVEDHYVHIALLKMLGYDDKAIHTIVLGGYRKLNVILFLLCIPFSLFIFVVFRDFFAMMFDYIFIMSLNPWHVFAIALLYVIIFMIATKHAKHKVNAVALSMALKIYQH